MLLKMPLSWVDRWEGGQESCWKVQCQTTVFETWGMIQSLCILSKTKMRYISFKNIGSVNSKIYKKKANAKSWFYYVGCRLSALSVPLNFRKHWGLGLMV